MARVVMVVLEGLLMSRWMRRRMGSQTKRWWGADAAAGVAAVPSAQTP